jgi:hypothetical protein
MIICENCEEEFECLEDQFEHIFQCVANSLREGEKK